MHEINIERNIKRSGFLGLSGLLIDPLCIREFNNDAVRVDGDAFGNIACADCISGREPRGGMPSVNFKGQRLVVFGPAVRIGGNAEEDGTCRVGGNGEGSSAGVVGPLVETYARVLRGDGEVVAGDSGSGGIDAQRSLFVEGVRE